jgi:hypothetical protein
MKTPVINGEVSPDIRKYKYVLGLYIHCIGSINKDFIRSVSPLMIHTDCYTSITLTTNNVCIYFEVIIFHVFIMISFSYKADPTLDIN